VPKFHIVPRPDFINSFKLLNWLKVYWFLMCDQLSINSS
jgi:hypothetical protein